MKGAAAALRAGDLVRVCERLERIAKRLPDQHESDATPRALVADVAAKIRALAADAAELRRVSTFPVAHAATRHGEALATKLGALVLVAARAFRLSVEVRAEMETVRVGGDDARVGSARRVSETRRRLFSETRASTKPRRRREKRLSRDVRGGEGVARHGERRRGDGRARTRARRARAVARDSRRRRVELARQRSETRRVSTRARGVRVGRVGRPRIRDAGRGARFGIGGIEQGIEQWGNREHRERREQHREEHRERRDRRSRRSCTRDARRRNPRTTRVARYARWRTRRRRDGVASRIPDARAHPRIPPRRDGTPSRRCRLYQRRSSLRGQMHRRGRRRRREGPRRTPRRGRRRRRR